jgi:hypothetical protein
VNLPFDEIVLVDFEFNGREGNRPSIVCVVAHELKSGRRFRHWHDQLGTEPPYRVDDKNLFVAFYASAELTCHLQLGWQMPANILDLFIEFRRLTNHSGEKQPLAGLLDALDHFRLDSIGARAKEHWRDAVMRGGPWSAEERAGILDYCESDVESLKKLLPVMPIPNLGQSLLRGSYMRADAWMRHWGIPIDKPLFDELSAHWTELRGGLITDLNTRYPFFDGPVFRKKLLERWQLSTAFAIGRVRRPGNFQRTPRRCVPLRSAAQRRRSFATAKSHSTSLRPSTSPLAMTEETGACYRRFAPKPVATSRQTVNSLSGSMPPSVISSSQGRGRHSPIWISADRNSQWQRTTRATRT